MNGSRSSQSKIAALPINLTAILIVLAISLFSSGLQAQLITTGNSEIVAKVDQQRGFVTVLLPPGNIGPDPQLCFQDKCFFSCQIGGTVFTNNDIVTLPANGKLLNGATTSKIVDTIRTIWFDKNGCDIIQDIYPVLISADGPKHEGSGQIVYKWKINNHSGVTVSVPSQYLQDVQITETRASHGGNQSNDGPTILTKWQYTDKWVQYPNSTFPAMPWFFIGFLNRLGSNASLDPGLSAMGYLDYGAPLFLTKPFRLTNGDWYDMARYIFGVNPSWNVNGSTSAGNDNAILLEFPAAGILDKKTVEIARTSYGTGEYEKCIGQLFSLVFYPHHLVWTKTPASGYYTPNPVHIEKFVVVPLPPQNTNSSSNTKMTLTVTGHLTLTDSLCKTVFGKSQTKPSSGPGLFLSPGGVGYFDWWACADPELYCTGTVIEPLKFTGTCGFCPPAFLNDQGADECDLEIEVDCAELDVDPPEYSDTLADGCRSISINVHDWRKDKDHSDKGLKSITYTGASGTDTSLFNISITPPLKGCYTDLSNHIVKITKRSDSLVTGCFDFTFEDCLGHKSFHSVCLAKCNTDPPHPDSLAPVYTLIKKWGSFDSTIPCNDRIDSFDVKDININDSGICKIDTIPGSVNNMKLNILPFSPKSSSVRFSVSVKDSMYDGNICIRATDCSYSSHYSDTCFHYCTIADITAPRIELIKSTVRAGLWHVTVTEDWAWDRGIRKISIVNPVNVTTPFTTVTNEALEQFDIVSNDTTLISSFCIEAEDSAGNKSVVDRYCGNQGVGKDDRCPNILTTPKLPTSQSSIDVDINDIHQNNPPTDTNRYVWDTGVDSVWFTNNTGMTTPGPISGLGRMTIPTFNIQVRDTTKTDSVACVTIFAKDKNGNTCNTTYCYPYIPDVLPPVMKLWYNPLNHSQILGYVTDSTIYDRGIYSIGLAPGYDNVTPGFDALGYNGQKVVLFDNVPKLLRNDLDKSTVGTAGANDLINQSFTTFNSANSVTAPIAIWIQDLTMPRGVQPDQDSKFSIPVRFVKNDNYPVIQKGITDFKIQFTLNGAANTIFFDGVSQANTESAGWTVTTSPAGSNPIIITASKPIGGSVLSADFSKYDTKKPETADSLIILNFHTSPNDATSQVTLNIDSLVYNNGRDTIYKGSNPLSSSLMPSPWGNLSGSNIVITGFCAPRLLMGTKPTSVSLDPNRPNPFTHTTTFNYTVAQEGPVRFYIYDALGKVMARIVDEDQAVGTYTVTFDGSHLSGGTYVARLENGGNVVSRRVTMKK